MTNDELLVEAYSRIHGNVHRVLDGISGEALVTRLDAEANSIAWLIWHLARIQDSHIAEARGAEQIWIAGSFVDRFGLPFDRYATGYGHNRNEVAELSNITTDLLLGYFDAVNEATKAFVSSLSADDLDRIVDRSFDPPVSLGVRLASVLGDNLQHAGQAAYVRGIVDRRS